MPTTCDFQLNHSNDVYCSGEIVSGAIILNNTSEQNVYDISIIFRGEEDVKWTKRKSKNNSVTYKANVLYLDNTTILCGEGKLPIGTHTYTFEILLPLQCPTSCEGRHGHIRYTLTVKLNRQMSFNKTFTKNLMVIKPLDLNSNQMYRLPSVNEENFTSCLWCCSTGAINTTLATSSKGYIVGQLLKFSLHVENQSMNDISGYKIEFIRKNIFTATSPKHKTKEEDITLCKLRYNDECLRLTTCNFEGDFRIELTIPSTECEAIIKVSYFIKATLEVTGCSTNQSISVPISIGTVPFRESAISTESDRLMEISATAPNFPNTDFLTTNEEFEFSATAPGVTNTDLPPSYEDLDIGEKNSCSNNHKL